MRVLSMRLTHLSPRSDATSIVRPFLTRVERGPEPDPEPPPTLPTDHDTFRYRGVAVTYYPSAQTYVVGAHAFYSLSDTYAFIDDCLVQ